MDRRQQKTRDAIFSAFSSLLAEKNFNQISVQEIIDKANIGRTTFYAHFETKEYLLKELCEELFGHIVDTAKGIKSHSHYSCDFKDDSVFLHLLNHLEKNELNILELLSSENNEIFLKYFKENLKELIISQYKNTGKLKNSSLPEDYLINHISSTFVETVSWWINNKMKNSPETITKYFLNTIEPIINSNFHFSSPK